MQENEDIKILTRLLVIAELYLKNALNIFSLAKLEYALAKRSLYWYIIFLFIILVTLFSIFVCVDFFLFVLISSYLKAPYSALITMAVNILFLGLCFFNLKRFKTSMSFLKTREQIRHFVRFNPIKEKFHEKFKNENKNYQRPH